MNAFAILFVVLSLVELSSSNVTARVRSEDVETAACRFVGYPTGAKSDRFLDNTNFWAKGIDLSCASPWNSGNGSLRAGTLISKRHVIFAQHFPLWKGVRIIFVGQDGGVCPLYIEGVTSVPNTDIGVGLLNAEVTPNVIPARILPDDYAMWIGTGEGLPVLTLDQRERASLTQLNGILTNGLARVWNRTPKSESWKRFFRRMVGGDSGNPAFALVADQPILLYCLKTGGPGSGTWIHRHKPAIQKAMDELCPGYKLEEFDFSRLIERK